MLTHVRLMMASIANQSANDG